MKEVNLWTIGKSGRTKWQTFGAILFSSLLLQSCVSQSDKALSPFDSLEETSAKTIELEGEWLTETDGDVMLNPQTSGLKYYQGHLYSLSDASADQSQIKRLHQIDAKTARVIRKIGPTVFRSELQSSCFYHYLKNEPDYEALVPVNDNLGTEQTQSTWIWVTEDASRSEPMSLECQNKYAATGSTQFPTLVVRLELGEKGLMVTHVRPIQFPTKVSTGNQEIVEVGNFPNDGIEGLALTRDNRLLLGLEKDAQGQPRVFSVSIDDTFWQEEGFALANDTELLLPRFESGNHPINGMDIYYPSEKSQGYLLAAARNDNELWIIDMAKNTPTKRIKLSFFAPVRPNADANCSPSYEMNNASIEGLAVVGQNIWMVNDPWKRNYMKNVQCVSDSAAFEKMAPLLFKMSLSDILQ